MGAESFTEFEKLATKGDTGVKMWRFLEVTPGLEKIWWANVVRNFCDVDASAQLPGYGAGVAFDNPIIDTSVYLPYMQNLFLQDGGRLFIQELSSVHELLLQYDIVINCSGLGARTLAKDMDLHPVRGQVVRIKRHDDDKPRLDLSSSLHFAHCIPRTTDTVLGGTYEENIESLKPSAEETLSIIERCKALLPRLETLSPDDILESRCGLRPRRPEVRLEREKVQPGKFVIHNYGHGGAGFSLSWGCATDVCALVAEVK